MRRRLVAFAAALSMLAVGPACAKKNEDKTALLKLVEASAHRSGVFRYADSTPKTLFGAARLAQVRGLIEDDFRYKARLTVNGQDALDEVVNDDALAVRFLDPSFVRLFTGTRGDSTTRAELAARYWVIDANGAPPIGDAAVTEHVIGVDPIVDSLSVIDYVSNAISAAVGVRKFNAESVDYRPAEDPFPRPGSGSGVVRWDLIPPGIPKVDATSQGGAGNASLARLPVFRKMAIYVRDGRVVQIREQIAAKFDLLNKLKNYVTAYVKKSNNAKLEASVNSQLKEFETQPAQLEAILNLAVNQILGGSGEDVVRFHSMKYEFSESKQKVHADVPEGPDVKEGSLAFFGVNQKANAASGTGTPASGSATTTTEATDAATTTTVP